MSDDERRPVRCRRCGIGISADARVPALRSILCAFCVIVNEDVASARGEDPAETAKRWRREPKAKDAPGGLFG